MLRRFARMLDDEALPLPTRVPDMSRPIPPSTPGHDPVRCLCCAYRHSEHFLACRQTFCPYVKRLSHLTLLFAERVT